LVLIFYALSATLRDLDNSVNRKVEAFDL